MVKETLKKAKGFWQRTEGYRLMLLVAGIFDLLSSIPWVGMIFSFLGYATLWLWMEMEGMSPGFSKKARNNVKKLGSMFAEGGAGVVGLSVFPGILLWAYFIISEYSQEVTEKEQQQLKATQKKLIQEQKQMKQEVREGNKRLQQRTKRSAYMQ